MRLSINLIDDEVEKAKIGYKTATSMIKILGQEIYSRFNAMLMANSIIIAVYGFIFSEKTNLPDFFKILLPIFGIVLCFLWFVFINNGIHRHRQYRKEAERLEETYFNSTFHLFRINYANDPCLLKCFRFRRLSIFVIDIFVLLHLSVLLYSCHKLLL